MKFLSFLVFFWLLFAGYVTYIIPTTTVIKQDFIVNRGDTIATLRDKLSMNIHPTIFKVYTRFFEKDFILQAGTYTIGRDTTLKRLFSETLRNPISKDITITLLPGWNIWDIDLYLTKEGVTKSGAFTKSAENIREKMRIDFPFLGKITTLEGMLVPDTYRISPEATSDTIVKMLLETFDTRVYKKFNFSSNAKLDETLIFASIIEKEEKSSMNKRIVAGILQKRYKEGMAIWADATVCYVYRLTMSECTPAFIGEYIYKKTAYNTRDSLELPPTPISNPSVETIRATIESQSSNYYYYLHDMDGVIHYGKTLEEHNRNRVDYLGK